MTTARDIMHTGARYIPKTETLDRAAQMMRDHEVGALPVADTDDRMCGIITDRDIVVKAIAHGQDPSQVTVGEICEGTPRWISADADIQDVLEEMGSRKIRRLPVIDENKRLVGMISEADVARHLSEGQIATFVEQIYVTS
ncbi:CBS domain-containing protein [Streptomyces sp. NPDC092296]|uniref:CBS domain-containing protein n=1 Tax=Streptomyces sp. NPDC092296 TaxID=3366012 RepID=UPI00380CA2D7